MKFSSPVLLSILALAVADQAPQNTDNTPGTIAVADFPKGTVVFYVKRGNKVKVHVDITGLPESGGPFQYHIHDLPVPASGDCNDVGQHFNPFSAPPTCEDQRDDSYCQVGDLSGKHGWIDTTCFETKYYDPYLSLNPASPSYIVGKSVVFHFANLTKFACANIELASSSRTASLLESYKEKGDLEVFGLENDEYDLNEVEFGAQDDFPVGAAAVSIEEHSILDAVSPIVIGDLQLAKVGKSDFNSTLNGTYNGVDLGAEGNFTNSSFASVVTTDCENKAGLNGGSVFTAALALIAGLFI